MNSLAQACNYSIAKALESPQSYTKLSIYILLNNQFYTPIKTVLFLKDMVTDTYISTTNVM